MGGKKKGGCRPWLEGRKRGEGRSHLLEKIDWEEERKKKEAKKTGTGT